MKRITLPIIAARLIPRGDPLRGAVGRGADRWHNRRMKAIMRESVNMPIEPRDTTGSGEGNRAGGADVPGNKA